VHCRYRSIFRYPFEVINMRPLKNTNSDSEKQTGDANKKDLERGAENRRKTRHDIDSSDESRSEES